MYPIMHPTCTLPCPLCLAREQVLRGRAQVELYADHEPARLMAFLVASQAYPLEAAAQLCEARGLVREQVFVLGRMGASHRALELIIRRLADVPQARPPPCRLPPALRRHACAPGRALTARRRTGAPRRCSKCFVQDQDIMSGLRVCRR